MPSEAPTPAGRAASSARELRGLAHATGELADQPDQMYDVLGSLSMALAALRYSLDQLAFWHQHHAADAVATEAGRTAGHQAAHMAANNLTTASHQIEAALRLTAAAHGVNGQIAWRPSADRSGRQACLPPMSVFETAPASEDNVIPFPNR